jgi:hypothetical protein
VMMMTTGKQHNAVKVIEASYFLCLIKQVHKRNYSHSMVAGGFEEIS